MALLFSLGLHTLHKLGAGGLGEMLWACHLATALLAVAVLAGAPRPAAVGFLFHVGIGLPACALDAIVNRATTPTSVLVHVLPLYVGWLVVQRHGLPRGAVPAAWCLAAAAQIASYLVTDPALNVNLAHAAWGPIERLVGGAWGGRALNAVVSVVFLLGARALILRALTRRPLTGAT